MRIGLNTRIITDIFDIFILVLVLLVDDEVELDVVVVDPEMLVVGEVGSLVYVLLEALAKHFPPVGFLNAMLSKVVKVVAGPGNGYSIANPAVLRHSPGPI